VASFELMRHNRANVTVEGVVALAVALNHPDTLRGVVLLPRYYCPTLRADALLSSPPAIPIIG
jgi:hypothetical protein